MTPSGREFTRIGVVVPAHNEVELLPGCLTALRCTAAAVDVPVHLLVVLDACRDRTAEVDHGASPRFADFLIQLAAPKPDPVS